jgi:hypothetical protein
MNACSGVRGTNKGGLYDGSGAQTSLEGEVPVQSVVRVDDVVRDEDDNIGNKSRKPSFILHIKRRYIDT